MVFSFFKVAWRNLVNNKVYAFINIGGLASGLACFILIVLYVADEMNFDRFNEKADRIYRIHSDIVFGGNALHLATVSDPMGEMLKKDYPEVENYVRFYNSEGPKLVRKGTEMIRESDVAHADSTVFDVFTLPLLAGDPKTALNAPNTVVVSESSARKYFGTTDVVGKTLETTDNQSTLYRITAVMKDIPKNSHFHFDMLFSMQNVDYQWGNFLSNNHQTYLLFRPGTDYHVFERNFKQYIDKYVIPQAGQFMKVTTLEDFEKAGNKLEYSLMPLTDIHLRSDRFPEFSTNGNLQYVYIFSAVALLVLVLACINFMNLSTARSANRAREVGIRKVVGSERRLLIGQFLTESILTTGLSAGLAIGLTVVLLPWFNDLAGKHLALSDLLRPGFILFLIILPLVVGLLAGSYPALYLSAFNPITVLKGKLSTGLRRSSLRNALVVTQFTISVFLIAATIVVYRQLHFIQNKKLGFSKDQVIVVNGTGLLGTNQDAFKTEVSRMAGVKGSAYAGYLPVAGYARNDQTYSPSPTITTSNGINMQTWNIDYDYIPLMEMELLAGRNFSRDFGSDSNAMIINEAAARLLGWGKDALGKKLYTYNESQKGLELTSREVVGVLKNFHFESMRENIGPICFRLGNNRWSMAFKVQTANIQSLVSSIGDKWKVMAGGAPFEYQFVDDAFDNMYRVEVRTGRLGLTLAVIAILIACLGLFGLAAYTAEQRRKEIGVRKVLGAATGNIVSMLSADFLKLVLIAGLIAIPLAVWLMNKWLEDFAYRVSLGWVSFALAGGVALLVALLTVSSQAIKAALVNPVKSLRSE